MSKYFIYIFFTSLTSFSTQATEFVDNLVDIRERAMLLYGNSIGGLHQARKDLASNLNFDPYIAAAQGISPETQFLPEEAIAPDIIRIEIENKPILYKIGKGSSASHIWIYETYLVFNDQRWLLHELPREDDLLRGAKALEFTYCNLPLSIPEELTKSILDLLIRGFYFCDCHLFRSIVLKNIELDGNIEVSFDGSLLDGLEIRQRPFSGSSNWYHFTPKIQTEEGLKPMDLTKSNPGSYFYFGEGHFGHGHSGVEIGPDLILSKLGSAGLSVAPVKSLGYNYSGVLRIREPKNSQANRINKVTEDRTQEKLEKFIEHLNGRFNYIKALDEYERKAAWLSHTDPTYVATHCAYRGLLEPGYEISAHEQFKFWLLKKIRESNNFKQLLDNNLDAIKRYVKISRTEKYWFNPSF